jgi:hypothetical protein
MGRANERQDTAGFALEKRFRWTTHKSLVEANLPAGHIDAPLGVLPILIFLLEKSCVSQKSCGLFLTITYESLRRENDCQQRLRELH